MGRKKERKRWQQVPLERARKATGRGGWRPGAGRPKGRTTVAHDRRLRFTASVPQHVTLRLVAGLASMRREACARIVRQAIAGANAASGDGFRVIEFCIMSNHLHLVVEAKGEVALARGMQGLGVRLARRLNGELGRRGSIFATRYHARGLRTPREVRNALRYVLLNARHHARAVGVSLARGWIDPFSSAPWFDGWRGAVRREAPWLRALLKEPRPTAAPRVWLLTTGWRRRGLIGVDEEPGEPLAT